MIRFIGLSSQLRLVGVDKSRAGIAKGIRVKIDAQIILRVTHGKGIDDGDKS